MRKQTQDQAMKRDNPVGSQYFSDLMAELLQLGNSVRFRANGSSMVPNIYEGEAITVEPVVPGDVKRGDIILYRSQRGVIAHRVVSLPTHSSVPDPDPLFLLRGDASLSCDEPVEARQILGRVAFVEREGGAVNLAGTAAKMWHQARRFAFHLKGWMSREVVFGE